MGVWVDRWTGTETQKKIHRDLKIERDSNRVITEKKWVERQMDRDRDTEMSQAHPWF